MGNFYNCVLMDSILKKIHSQIESEIESKYLEKVEFDSDCERTFNFITDNDSFEIEATIEISNYCGNEEEEIYNYPTHEMEIKSFKVINAMGLMSNLENIKNWINEN